MTSRREQGLGRRPSSPDSSYWAVSKRPLQILAFLLPLIVAYELGLALVLRSEAGVLSNVAHIRLLQFFEEFGIHASSGMFLGGILIIVILFVWHLLTRDPWQIDGRALGLMALESLALTLPLIMLGQLIAQGAISAVALSDPGATTQVGELDLWSRLAISVGAGLYEELLFRMLLIALIHTLLVDVGGASSALGAAIAVVAAALAFTWYHPLTDETGSILLSRVLFYFLAGLYFGAIFVLRGFGIVVAVHVLYDIAMLTFTSNP